MEQQIFNTFPEKLGYDKENIEIKKKINSYIPLNCFGINSPARFSKQVTGNQLVRRRVQLQKMHILLVFILIFITYVYSGIL